MLEILTWFMKWPLVRSCKRDAIADALDQLPLQKSFLTARIRPASNKWYQAESGYVPESYSTIGGLCGAIVASVVVTLFASQIVQEWSTGDPQVSSVMTPAVGANYSLPDIAITFAKELTEAQMLNYITPQFKWISIKNGMIDRKDEEQCIDDVKFGSECSLEVGYKPSKEMVTPVQGNATGTPVQGSAKMVTPVQGNATGTCGAKLPRDQGAANPRWPVFCILGSKLQLRGHFGDPSWDYLQVKINPCKEDSADNRLRQEWRKTGGACAPKHVMQSELEGLGINIWLKTKNESWAQYRENDQQLKPARGQYDDWAWYVYLKLASKTTIAGILDLMYNRAIINSPLLASDKKEEGWFTFHSWSSSPSGTTSADFLDQTMLILSVRTAQLKREVTVRYMTVQEALTQVGGSWNFSCVAGVCIFQAYVMFYQRSRKCRKKPSATCEPSAGYLVKRNLIAFRDEEAADRSVVIKHTPEKQERIRPVGKGSAECGAFDHSGAPA